MALIKTCLLLILCLFSVSLVSQTKKMGKYYPDGHGGEVLVPLGDITFADEIVSYIPGDPPAVAKDSSLALGIPDYDGRDGNFVSLGCGGTLVVRFTNNSITDVSGPDIYVFELGKYVEKTLLKISKDGKNWVEIGEISGGQTMVDISAFVSGSEVFSYLSLTDLKTSCAPKDSWAGADIDAVAALGSAINITLQSAVLFASGKSALKPEAQQELQKVLNALKNYPKARVLVYGHTDNTGAPNSNMTLSNNRSKSVKDFLVKNGIPADLITTSGYGDTRPIGPNTSPEGKEKNRRVEVIIIPQ